MFSTASQFPHPLGVMKEALSASAPMAIHRLPACQLDLPDNFSQPQPAVYASHANIPKMNPPCALAQTNISPGNCHRATRSPRWIRSRRSSQSARKRNVVTCGRGSQCRLDAAAARATIAAAASGIRLRRAASLYRTANPAAMIPAQRRIVPSSPSRELAEAKSTCVSHS
ncbi:MAG: hypothetical protein B6D40_00520 [Anaerolineae bacterium UTCFX3]|nr:MAG: hypothetical protein B6D40_00520 [Anaerolineae bacterium UTCFX3]